MTKPRQVPEVLREWVRQRVEADGLPSAAEALGLADATLARVIAGLGVQRGTVAIVERAHEREIRSAH